MAEAKLNVNISPVVKETLLGILPVLLKPVKAFLADLKKDGRITESEIDALLEELQAAVPSILKIVENKTVRALEKSHTTVEIRFEQSSTDRGEGPRKT